MAPGSISLLTVCMLCLPLTGKIESSGRLAKKRRLPSLKRRKKKIYRGEELVNNKNGGRM